MACMKLETLLKDIDAVIFDLDGTLIDSLKVWNEVDMKFFSIHGREVPSDYTQRIAHMSFTEIAKFTKEEYGFSESIEQIMKMWDDWAREAYHSSIQAKPGAYEFLKKLFSLNVPISLATSNRRSFYEPCLKRLNLSNFFSYDLNVNELGSAKTDPKIYLELASKMHSTPSRTLVFEDIYIASNTAKNAGFKLAVIEDEVNAPDLDKLKAIADFYLKDYTEIGF